MSELCRFSVIIPVYNRAATIDRCLASLSAQSFDNFEIIVVDDGSSDRTREKLLHWQQRCNKIYCVFQRNNGVSSARNTGIKSSVGEYLVFVDSDDWVETEYLKEVDLLLLNERADCVIFDYFVDMPDCEPKKSGFSDCLPLNFGTDYFRKAFSEGKINNSICDKIVKRSLFVDFDIWFPENLSIGEDGVVVSHIGCVGNSFIVSRNAYLHYVQNLGSLSREKTSDAVWQQIQEAVALISNALFTDQQSQLVLRMKFIQLFYYYMTYSSLRRDCQFHEFKRIVKDLHITGASNLKLRFKIIIAKLSLLPIVGFFIRETYSFFMHRY